MSDTALTYLTKISKALQQAKTFDDFRNIRAMAKMGLQALKANRDDRIDDRNELAEYVLRAEKAMGAILKETKKSGGRQKPGEYKKFHLGTFCIPPSLSEIGVTKKQSHRFQSIDDLPDEQFDTVIRETKEAREEVTQALLLKAAKEQKKEKKKAARLKPKTQTCTTGDLRKLIDQRQKFGTIYVDPPWCYGNQATRSATDNHYETLTLEQIVAHPIPELAADECHLHLWTTNAFLHDSFHLLEQWGFEFKSLLVWDKDKLGIGNYWRLQTEYLLLGVKGSLTFLDHSQPNLVRGARGKHSAKPEQVRRMIEKVSPGPRLEMFARRISNGWVAWGNEIERTMFDADVKEIT